MSEGEGHIEGQEQPVETQAAVPESSAAETSKPSEPAEPALPIPAAKPLDPPVKLPKLKRKEGTWPKRTRVFISMVITLTEEQRARLQKETHDTGYQTSDIVRRAMDDYFSRKDRVLARTRAVAGLADRVERMERAVNELARSLKK